MGPDCFHSPKPGCLAKSAWMSCPHAQTWSCALSTCNALRQAEALRAAKVKSVDLLCEWSFAVPQPVDGLRSYRAFANHTGILHQFLLRPCIQLPNPSGTPAEQSIKAPSYFAICVRNRLGVSMQTCFVHFGVHQDILETAMC